MQSRPRRRLPLLAAAAAAAAAVGLAVVPALVGSDNSIALAAVDPMTFPWTPSAVPTGLGQPVFEKDSKYKGKITAYDSPIYIADSALYLMKTKPELGIKNPYALDQKQFDAAVALLKQQNANIGEYWSYYLKEISAFKSGDSVLGTTWQVIAGCDDGNIIDGDGCSDVCVVEVCGNKILDPGEACDDGKHCADLQTACTADADCAGIGDGLCAARNEDGCSAACVTEFCVTAS